MAVRKLFGGEDAIGKDDGTTLERGGPDVPRYWRRLMLERSGMVEKRELGVCETGVKLAGRFAVRIGR